MDSLLFPVMSREPCPALSWESIVMVFDKKRLKLKKRNKMEKIRNFSKLNFSWISKLLVYHFSSKIFLERGKSFKQSLQYFFVNNDMMMYPVRGWALMCWLVGGVGYVILCQKIRRFSFFYNCRATFSFKHFWTLKHQ